MKPTGPKVSSPPAGVQPPARSDEELACRAQAGSLVCFAELVDRYESRLLNFLRRRVASATDAEDLTQDTFLAAWKRIDRFKPTYRFSTWIFTIAARLGASHHRAQRRRSRRERIAAEHAQRRPGAVTPRDAASTAEQSRDLWAVADRLLPDETRSALWLRYAEDMPMGQIARVLGRTPVGVRVMLFRARQTLAEHLEPDAVGVATTPRAAETPAMAGGAA